MNPQLWRDRIAQAHTKQQVMLIAEEYCEKAAWGYNTHLNLSGNIRVAELCCRSGVRDMLTIVQSRILELC